MITYIIRRMLMMIPTLLVISLLVFIIIELPPGDYIESYIAQLEAQGEQANPELLNFLRQQYGLDKPAYERYFGWITGMVQGDFGYSFEYRMPVSEVIGDRLLLTILISIATIMFTWIIAFPIALYSATHQYSWGDYGLTLLGLLGLATPNFLLALIMLYFANVVFGTSIGGLMDPEFLDQPWSVDKAISVLEHLWVPVVVIGTSGTAGMIRRLRANLLDEPGKLCGPAAPRQGGPRGRQLIVKRGNCRVLVLTQLFDLASPCLNLTPQLLVLLFEALDSAAGISRELRSLRLEQ